MKALVSTLALLAFVGVAAVPASALAADVPAKKPAHHHHHVHKASAHHHGSHHHAHHHHASAKTAS